jgi:hypothetical protein
MTIPIQYSNYDRKVYRIKDDLFFAWLEIKAKKGAWEDFPTDMLQLPKWEFAERSKKIPYYNLVEKNGVARLFDITQMIKDGEGEKGFFERRDRPEDGKQPVVRFNWKLSKVMWS